MGAAKSKFAPELRYRKWDSLTQDELTDIMNKLTSPAMRIPMARIAHLYRLPLSTMRPNIVYRLHITRDGTGSASRKLPWRAATAEEIEEARQSLHITGNKRGRVPGTKRINGVFVRPENLPAAMAEAVASAPTVDQMRAALREAAELVESLTDTLRQEREEHEVTKGLLNEKATAVVAQAVVEDDDDEVVDFEATNAFRMLQQKIATAHGLLGGV